MNHCDFLNTCTQNMVLFICRIQLRKSKKTDEESSEAADEEASQKGGTISG